jgi:septum site-determining protein MinD
MKNDLRSEAQVLAIVSGKGGTGKSMLISSMGYMLAHCGFKTLMVDMDLSTCGLSFYSLGDYPRQAPIGMQDFLLANNTIFPTMIPIPHSFCSQNLFIIPAISKRHKRPILESSTAKLSAVINGLRENLNLIINHAINEYKYDYILFDTRGGSDHISILTAQAAKSYIIVTEADKTSWDVGSLLLSGIDQVAENNTEIGRLGFIINKNVLPSEAIEAYLIRQWECPPLCTIPLDENAIRYFQEDKVPVAENPYCPFSMAVIPIIRKLFYSEAWKSENIGSLLIIENEIQLSERKHISTNKLLKTAERFSLTIKNFTTFLMLGILTYWGFLASRSTLDYRDFMMLFILMGIAFLFNLLSDPYWVRGFVSFFKSIYKIK